MIKINKEKDELKINWEKLVKLNIVRICFSVAVSVDQGIFFVVGYLVR